MDLNRGRDDIEKVAGEDEPLDAVDVAVLARLADVVEQVDPVPTGLVDRSLFAMTLAGLEAEVMELQHVEAPVGSVRGDAPPLEARTITFTHERLTVMIALSPADDGVHVRVDGWIAPAGSVPVQLRRPEGTTDTVSDEDGRFVLDAVERGPGSLLVRLPGDGGGEITVSTPVVEI